MVSIGFSSLFLTKQHIAQVSAAESLGFSDPILGISVSEVSRKLWMSSGQGLLSEAGHGDLKGVFSQASRISKADTGGVDIPEKEMTLELLMDRALMASAALRHVAAKTPGNLLANMETPEPVPQARRPRVVSEPAETRLPTSAEME